MKWKTPLLAAMFLALSQSIVSARSWTDNQGRKLEAELVRVEGASAWLRIGGKETPVPLVSLSVEDRAFITQ